MTLSTALIPLALFIGVATRSRDSDECVARNFGHGSVVCECNSTHCDSIGSDTLPALGQFLSFTSSKAGSRLQRGRDRYRRTALELTVVPYQKYQRIRGFGGTMTDSAAINILSLSPRTQDQLLRQYFSAQVWCGCPLPAVTSQPICTPMPTHRETRTWTTLP
uniref:Glucosylceramidase n=1 Tax=Hucho hucho TaxID=62062 RepID=A0A4W5JY23_9TELE